MRYNREPAVTEDVGHKSFRRQIRAPVIAASKLGTGEVKLPGDSDGDRMQTCVEHEHLRVPFGGTDRHRGRIVRADDVRCHRDGGLGRTVQIHQLGVAEFCELGRGRGRHASPIAST